MGLRSILTGFADALLATSDPTETVAVAVVRRDGFQNHATTPAGLPIPFDEPAHFGGRGEAPDPAQYLLAAIGASLSVTLTAHAAMRGLVIDDVAVSLDAVIDGRAFFHPGSGAPAGLLDIKATLVVRSPATEADFRALLVEVLLATPVLRTLKQAPAITLRYNEER